MYSPVLFPMARLGHCNQRNLGPRIDVLAGGRARTSLFVHGRTRRKEGTLTNILKDRFKQGREGEPQGSNRYQGRGRPPKAPRVRGKRK